MGDLLIRGLDDALKRDIAERAEKSGVSLSEKAKQLLRQGLSAGPSGDQLAEPSGYQALRTAYLLAGKPDEAFAGIMGDIEAERKKDLGSHVGDSG